MGYQEHVSVIRDHDEAKSTDKTIRIYQGMQHSLSHGEFEEYKERVFNDIIVWILERC